MSDAFVWGTLPKAQDDATTIDEAITAAIAAHNADPTAHMDDAASLGIHRINDVIDHPAASVLADKATASEVILQTMFENPAVFDIGGSPSFAFPGFLLQPSGTTISGADSVTINGENQGMLFNFSKDMLFQFVLFADLLSNTKFVFQIDGGEGPSTERNMGLEIIGTTAKFFVAKNDGTSKTYVTWTGYGGAETHVVRLQIVGSTHTAYFFVDGVEIGSVVHPQPLSSDVMYAHFQAWNTGSGGSQTTNIANFYCQLSPNF